jgi:multidrug efflux pump subunit AcrB
LAALYESWSVPISVLLVVPLGILGAVVAAFILGVTPLAISSGAGAASQNAIGIAVIGGMFAATFLAIFFVPMFFVMVQKITK